MMPHVARAGLTYDAWAAAGATEREELRVEFSAVMRKIQHAALPDEAQTLWDAGIPVNYVRDLYPLSALEAQKNLLARVAGPRGKNQMRLLSMWVKANREVYQLDVDWLRAFCKWRGVVELPLEKIIKDLEGGGTTCRAKTGEIVASVMQLLAGLATFNGFQISVTEMSTIIRAYQFWEDLLVFVEEESP